MTNDPNKIKYYAQELIPETYNYLHKAVESYLGTNSFTYIWYQADDGYYTNDKNKLVIILGFLTLER